MAKRGRPSKKAEAEQTPTQKAGATPVHTLKRLLNKGRAAKKDVQSINGTFGQAVADAVENQHLHRKAFAHIRQEDTMEPEKLLEYFTMRDYYEDVLGLREKAAKAGRLELGDQPSDGEPESLAEASENVIALQSAAE